ncbi:LOW QUALITY PROTEIN: heterokaryon incompatibility protein [Colletotrichum tofieldiae]|nr:LOW QUALITY PROTEIN: heterokaryon incompatibility protein [Colletotrichum tofieldiae]
MAALLGWFTLEISLCYGHSGSLEDLDRAIETAEMAVELTPEDSPPALSGFLALRTGITFDSVKVAQ